MIKFRTIGYMVLWFALISAFTMLLFTRERIEAVLLRQPGMLAQKLPDGYLGNLYTLKIFNKTFDPQPASIRISHVPAEIRYIDVLKTVPAQNVAETRFLIAIKREIATAPNLPLEVEIWSGEKMVSRKKTVFIASGG